MPWVKIKNGTKRIISPDGNNFIYPTELYSNGIEGELLFFHLGKYYIITNETKYKLKFTTNSSALLSKYSDDFQGRKKIAEHCITNNSESLLSPFYFKSKPAYNIELIFSELSYDSEYVIFFCDGKYRLRTKKSCDGSFLKKLYAKFYWNAEPYSPTWNYSTFVYPEFEGSKATIYTNCNNSDSNNSKKNDNLLISSTNISGSWLIDWDLTSDRPESDWLGLGETSESKYFDLYAGLAQTEYIISSTLNVYNMYESNTLMGEYTGINEAGEQITRNVGFYENDTFVSKKETVMLFSNNANIGNL